MGDPELVASTAVEYSRSISVRQGDNVTALDEAGGRAPTAADNTETNLFKSVQW
jgi:hypothetical protein